MSATYAVRRRPGAGRRALFDGVRDRLEAQRSGLDLSLRRVGAALDGPVDAGCPFGL